MSGSIDSRPGGLTPYVPERVAPTDTWQGIHALERVLDGLQLKVLDERGELLAGHARRPALGTLLGPQGQARLEENRASYNDLLDQPLAENPVEAMGQLLRTYAEWFPGAPLQLHNLGSRVRMDDLVLAAMGLRMGKQKAERTELSEQLKSLTAELKIFSVIQSKVNLVMAEKGEFKPADEGFNLLDPKLYDVPPARWKDSAEYRLLSGLSTFASLTMEGVGTQAEERVTVQGFLTGALSAGRIATPAGPLLQKVSGQMSAADLKDSYAWGKDANPLANFSQALSDRARTVNDKVTEQTTLLNDAGSRYSTSIEVMMKFVEKFFSMLSKILQN